MVSARPTGICQRNTSQPNFRGLCRQCLRSYSREQRDLSCRWAQAEPRDAEQRRLDSAVWLVKIVAAF